MASDIPQVSVSLSLNPAIYSVYSDEPPQLNLTVTSHYTSAITIFADDLSPQLMLRTGCALVIIDLTDNTVVKQTTRTNCRIPPPTKVVVPLQESMFYTLYPEQPLTLSAPFVLASKICDRNEVDSLKPDHKYMITLSGSQRLRWYSIRWWEYGTKDEVLAKGLDGRKVWHERGPHEPIEIDVTGVPEKPIYLDCTP